MPHKNDDALPNDRAGIPRPLFWYLATWCAGSFGAFAWQLFFPRLAERRSVWGYAPGWQRELALWNAPLDVGIVATLLKDRADQARALGSFLVLLASLLGLNHLHAALREAGRTASVHRLGAAVNLALGAGWGAVAVRRAGEPR